MHKNEHLSPWECTYAKEDKSKCRPGRKPESDQKYFEVLGLCILQAGLNWGIVRKNWPKIRQGFYNFDINRLSKARMSELLKRPGVYKNKIKVEAIIKNAKEFQRIRRDLGNFSRFLKMLENKEAVKQLTKEFRHVGEYTAEYYLHSVGYL